MGIRSGLAVAITVVFSLVSPESAVAVGSEEEAAAREGRRLLEAGRNQEAEQLLESASQEYPGSPDLLGLLGKASYWIRNYVASEEALRRAVELGQRDAETWFYFCSSLWENGRLIEAETACRAAIKDQGPMLPLVHLLGRLYLWQGRYQEAVTWLERAVSQSRGSVDLWLDLAGSLDGAERSDEALVAYRQALTLAPEHYQVRYGLARALARSGDREGAARELEVYQQLLEGDQARTLEKGLLEAQVEHGYELMRQGDAATAASHLESLPASVEVLVALSETYRKLGRSEESLQALERAVALAPERGDLRIRLSAARLAEGPST